ncbi:MAG TPA: 2'-deoxycytidine 5'-triphosphate deaminase [Alphaproteobacteria bacterium]|nr:2'-deoxycytidine 5'-triphosphate deaminase [Alphaproteobacteria bacterium]HAJ47781.1 2'-deoxycytidine 5'-triphosphate deaminase [Alphaproteobacteria bacterium]
MSRSDPHNARPGILPAAGLTALSEAGAIRAVEPLAPGQVQPASLDLRLGARAWRVRASFLPGAQATVAGKLPQVSLHELDLRGGAVFEAGCVYVVELMEALRLPEDIAGIANPKSSTGRLDVFTRLICDRAREFDRVPAGYDGPLFAEVSPRTFSLLVRTGSRLNQLRLRRGPVTFGDEDLRALQARARVVDGEADIDQGIALTVDLANSVGGRIGYRAKRHAGLIDIDRVNAYEALDYWEPLTARPNQTLVLDPNEFYILASREAVSIPPDFAAEMVPYNPLVGEFRVHYAGFMDPGFGYAGAGGKGARIVLEVRSHDVPFILEHGQIIGRLIFEPLTEAPALVYGQGLGSHYQAQGLKLSKHFRV